MTSIAGADIEALGDIERSLRDRCLALHKQLGRDAMLRQNSPVETIYAVMSAVWSEGFSEGNNFDMETASLITALRARVAELEARATPQAGASEAESVMPSMAKHRDGCEYSRSPIWLCDCPRPYLATPQDSDAVRALRNIAEGNLGDYPWQANYEKIREVARAALSGKGGSNG